ncbi:MAG TPA: glycosyltransferase family 39 protein [Candidatus Limnocylindrales bacterium]|nr:glycosyltransferase family 39 protein [Candidatus Limnocylindrales bacterium]
MALYYVLLRFWSHINAGVFFLRLLSVLPAVATVPVLYLLGKRLFSTRAALFSALLFSLNTFHVYYSQAPRGYSLAVFLVTAVLPLLHQIYFIRTLENPTGTNTIVYVIASTAAMYGHFFASFVLVAQFVALALRGSATRVVHSPHPLINLCRSGLHPVIHLCCGSSNGANFKGAANHRQRDLPLLYLYERQWPEVWLVGNCACDCRTRMVAQSPT